MCNLFIDFHGGHSITGTLANGVVDMVEEDAKGPANHDARVDDLVDVHVSTVIYVLVFLTSTLWSLSVLVGGLLWPVGVSAKTHVAPIDVLRGHDHSCGHLLCEDQRSRDTIDFKKDKLTMWLE
ncbi:hypothetical protein AC1031_016010 [Aphanomyces cochlioides]|nr:hypothetical protein AC1031_016010 [Aphanomyces cochlioides]